MRPADHPEFFRLPAPEGRSRESTIVLDAEGRFHHDGELVEHPGDGRPGSLPPRWRAGGEWKNGTWQAATSCPLRRGQVPVRAMGVEPRTARQNW